MPAATAVEVGELVDGQRIGRFAIVFLIVATFILVSDGYDLFAVGFVGPELVRQWHIGRAALGPLLSAGVIGLLIGGPLLGYIGDRFGRKKAILIGLIGFGAFSLLSMAATSIGQLVALRFVTGIGLGGVIPNVIALTAEFAPKRRRGTFLIIVNFGVPAGAIIPGWVAALLVPSHGWPVLFLVGGVLPLAIAALAWAVLPESIKLLVERGDRQAEVRRIARILRPDLALGGETRFFVAIPSRLTAGVSPAPLFKGGLGAITPVLWLALAADQVANFFTNSWLPTLLQASGASTAQAGVAASMLGLGGLLGGLALIFFIDRLGVIPIAFLYVLGAPLVAAIGIPGLPLGAVSAIIAGTGFCVIGINFGMNATMGMIYPTPIRSNGAGWAQAIGRLGAVCGPILGAVLLGMRFPASEIFLAPALSLILGAVACGVLALLCRRRFHGYQLTETGADGAAPDNATVEAGLLPNPSE